MTRTAVDCRGHQLRYAPPNAAGYLFRCAAFSRDADGDFIAEAAIEVRSARQAKATASRMATAERGAIAFAKTGDPQLVNGTTRSSSAAMVMCLMMWRPTHPADQLRVREAAGDGRSFGMDIVDTAPVAVGYP